jgi:CAAX prenyl protease-like protein
MVSDFDENRTDETEPGASAATKPSTRRPLPGPRVFGRFAVMIVVVPLVVYLAGMQIASYIEDLRIATIEGTIHQHDEGENRIKIDRSEAHKNVDPNEAFLLGMFYLKDSTYPYTYVSVIALTVLFMLPFAWGYFRAPFRISIWSVVIGVVGVVVWIGLSELDRATFNLGKWAGERPSFNPFDELKGNPNWMWTFLAIRFFGLVCLVPIIEEFFVRGFLMRYVDDPDWDEIPLGEARFGGWISPTVYGLVAHLTEPLSALVWFSMVSWLYKKTGSIWDCVMAHAVTNLLLGLYVVKFGQWHLW